MKITAHKMRDGAGFRFADHPAHHNKAPIIAIGADEVVATYHVSDIWHLPAETPVIVAWHGKSRTDGFLTTVGGLLAKAELHRENDSTGGKQDE